MKKNYFSLIEILVSIFLISFLLIFLFNHFSNIIKLEEDIKILKKESLKKSNLHSKLSYILNQIKIEKPIFYTEYEKNAKFYTVFFEFDNGIDPSPNFSYFLNGKLFVNKNNQLVFHILSFDKNEKREEILFNNVNTFKINFYSLEDKNLNKFLIKNFKKDLFCYSFWPKEKSDIPSMVEVFINDLKFSFFIPKKNIILEL